MKCCENFNDQYFESSILNLINKIFKDDVYECKVSALENFTYLSKFIPNEKLMIEKMIPSDWVLIHGMLFQSKTKTNNWKYSDEDWELDDKIKPWTVHVW